MTYPMQTPADDQPIAPVVDLRTGKEITPTTADDSKPDALSGQLLPAATSPWEKVRLAAERPLVPAWVTDRSVAGYRARWLMRAAVRQSLRSPLVAVRLLPVVGRGIGRGTAAWWRWVAAHDLVEEAAELRAVDKRTWRDARTLVRQARKRRAWISLATLAAAGGGVAAGGLVYGPLVWVGCGTVATLAAGVAGRRPGERILTAAAPARPVELGMPASQLHSTIAAVMAGLRLDVTVLRSQPHPWGWDVQIMAGQALSKVADKVDEIEARLRTRPGAVTVMGADDDAGMATLRIVWADPLAALGSPARRAPRSLSARGPQPIGRSIDGSETRLVLLSHTVWVGKSRSGKSSAIWTVLDALTAAEDVVVWGGDLSDAPALNIWGGLVRYASTAAALEGMLKAAISIGKARGAVIGRRLRPTADSAQGVEVDENWQPTADGPALVLVLDEYPLIVEAGLGGLVEEFLRTAAKGAGYAHIASQRAGRTEMGTTTVKAMAVNKVLLSCEAGDVEILLGPGRRAAGWRPDRLKPAADGKANDAGRCYIDAPGHTDPQLHAVYRLEATEVRDRAIERLRHAERHGMPRIDTATWEAADADARKRWGKSLDELLAQDGDLTGTATAVPDRETGRVLADVLTVMGEQAAMHTCDILPALAGLSDRYADVTAAKLADALRPSGVTSAQLRNVNGKANSNGYKRADIEAANARLSGR